MRKLIAALLLLLAAISYGIVVLRYRNSFISWLLVSYAPVMLLGAVLLMLKMGMLQTLLVPALAFYGIGTFVAVDFSPAHAYLHFSSAAMMITAGYIIFTQLLKLHIMRTVFRLALGALLFAGFLFARERLADQADLRKVAELESRLLFNR